MAGEVVTLGSPSTKAVLRDSYEEPAAGSKRKPKKKRKKIPREVNSSSRILQAMRPS